MDVLLADPDNRRRTAAAATLRAVGWEVREHAGASEAVAASRTAAPDVLVVDEDACRADDLRVIDSIKRDPDLFAIGVVVRARGLDVDDALDGLARGAHGVLVDPVTDADLVATVRSAARTSALQAELRNRAEDLERLAFSDGLTGLPNRRFLDRQLDALISSARRHGRPLALMLIDADRFKAINDTHGHAVGDEVLAELARRLGSRLRTADHLGRFGGEEFLALLPETAAESAYGVAEDLRHEVAGRPVQTAAGPVGVTVSIGVAEWDGEPPHSVIGRADEALYRAKAEGRNRVEVGATAART